MKKRERLFALALLMGLSSGGVFAADPGLGGQLYSRNCATCHGDDGKGTLPGVPDFTRGEGLFQSNENLLRVIRDGKSVMPAFKGILTDDEIRDLIAYLRMYR